MTLELLNALIEEVEPEIDLLTEEVRELVDEVDWPIRDWWKDANDFAHYLASAGDVNSLLRADFLIDFIREISGGKSGSPPPGTPGETSLCRT